MSFFKNANCKRLLLTAALGLFTISLTFLFVFLIINGGKTNPKPYNVNLKNYTYYAVSLGKYDSLQQAKTEADKVIVRGGAGYIAEFKGFNVLAALYVSKSDAESVVKSLKASEINAEIFIIEIPKIYVKSDFDYSGSLNGLLNTIDSLCGLYYKIDGENLSLESALNGLITIINELESILENIVKQENNLLSIRIKAEFRIVLSYLSNLLTLENADTLSLKIKQTEFKIIFGITDLFREISD